jgi:cytochrome b subunit of formate dehydrogenase
MWAVTIHLYKVKLPWAQLAKITFISTLAALTAHYVEAHLHPLLGILFGGGASLLVLFGLFYMMRVLEPEDHIRLNTLIGMLPSKVRGPADKFLTMLIRPELADVTEKSLP